jgi:carbonic anhydrase/acetyltransferase-like protein (isoleucine patch superfamily)
MSLNQPVPEGPAPSIAASAVLIGEASLGAGVVLAQGVVIRAHSGAVSIGNHSAVLENSSIIGTPADRALIGQRTVFGHRCQVVGARVGDLCEIGNGSILMPGARLGDGCILGEGTVVPDGMVIPDETVLVGRPPHVLRTASDADRERVARLRNFQTDRTDHPHRLVAGQPPAGAAMGRLYAYRDKTPTVASSALLFDSAEITGDVVVGEDTIIGAGVKIIGDSHGPVRIGRGVQILENTVLHLLPDNELVVEDWVVIGPGAMIHGCRLGEGTLVEPAAIVCDWSRVGAGSLVRAGACVKQRADFPERSVLDGFPARVVGTLDAPPARPGWALTLDDVGAIARLR